MPGSRLLRCLFWTICELYMVEHHIVEVAYWACCCLTWSHDNPVSRHSLSPNSCSCEKNLKNLKYAGELFRDFQSCRHFLSRWVYFLGAFLWYVMKALWLPAAVVEDQALWKLICIGISVLFFRGWQQWQLAVNFVCFDCKCCQTYNQAALWVKAPCWVSLRWFKGLLYRMSLICGSERHLWRISNPVLNKPVTLLLSLN